MRDSAWRNFVATGRGETALPVDVGPLRGQPNQPGRAGERGPYLSGESSGDSVATTGSDGNSAKAAEGSTFTGRCFKGGKKGHRVVNCMVKLCSGCNGRGHAAAAVRPTSKEEAEMAVASEVGARNDNQE